MLICNCFPYIFSYFFWQKQFSFSFTFYFYFSNFLFTFYLGEMKLVWCEVNGGGGQLFSHQFCFHYFWVKLHIFFIFLLSLFTFNFSFLLGWNEIGLVWGKRWATPPRDDWWTFLPPRSPPSTALRYTSFSSCWLFQFFIIFCYFSFRN